jgi:hypothetical protein
MFNFAQNFKSMLININDRNAILLNINFPKAGLADGEVRIKVQKHEQGKPLEIDFSTPDESDTVFLVILENAQFGGVYAPV